ncbi:Ribophorin I [Coemansia spiralis]|nr:Ribophorin I [Coemansia spiralis]
MRIQWLLAVFVLLGVAAAAQQATGLVNTNLIRTVSLANLPYVMEQIGVVVQNDHSSKVFKTYTLPAVDALPLSSQQAFERKSGVELNIVDGKAVLKKPLQLGEKLSINVERVLYTGAMPVGRVGQTEDQVWEWPAQMVSSVYPIRKQKTVVSVPGEIKQHVNATVEGRKATFVAPGVIRFKANGVQLMATYRREYFVSHWANDLNILDHYDMRSLAPQPRASFDKVSQLMAKFMKTRDNFVKTLLVKVPREAREMYVVDEIGNVSTSLVASAREEFKVMQLRPRYPMLGGWNYTWWHGYSVPLTGYLRTEGTKYRLRVPFMGSIAGCAESQDQLTVAMAEARNTLVSQYELRVVLPEGAHDVSVRAAPTGDIRLVPLKYYLDSTGRTVVVVEARNVAPGMADQDVLVEYEYPGWALWQKPMVVGGVVFVLFMLASLVNRLHLGLATREAGTKS